MENTISINASMGDLGAYYVAQKYYDPNSSDRICAIEFPNNSLIYIKYEKEWTVKELIEAILKTKEFRLLYLKRDIILDGFNHINLFDLQICLYNQIKPDYENKINYNVKIDLLHEKGLLKNHKYPFFLFKDNRAPFSFNFCSNQIKSDVLKNVIDTKYETNAIYSLYLPKVNTMNKLNSFPQLEDYFIRNKKGYNEFTPFNLNPLLNEHDQFDWFIYDEESINFLIDMNKTNIEINSKLKLIKNKLYFMDTIENEQILIEEESLKNFFLNLFFEVKNPETGNMDLIKQKVRIKLETTGYDLIEKMNKKIKVMSKTLGYDSNKMILKVRSLNDYVFDLNKPMCICTYITECIRHNLEADYIILENPIYSKEPKEEKNEIIEENNENNNINNINQEEKEIDISVSQNYGQNLTCVHFPFDNLLSIATYDPLSNNINSDIENVNISLTKSADEVNNPKLKDDNLDLFIKSLTKDLNKEIKSNYDNALNNIGNDNEINSQIKKNLNEKYEIEDLKDINDRLTLSDMNNSTFLYMNTSVSLSMSTVSGPIRKRKRKSEMVITPNVYVPEHQSFDLNDINNLISLNEAPINIRDIDRPFNILLKGIHFKELFNSLPFEHEFTTIFMIKIQLYLGSEPYSKPYELKWKNSSKDYDPVFNKRIYFDLSYNSIPNFCSVLFKIKFLQYNELGTLVVNSTKYWGNFKLFDHNMRLKTGTFKLNLYDRLFTDDAYYYFSDNDDEEKSSKIYFELDSFPKSVINKITRIKNFKFEPNSVMINDIDKKNIEEINKRSPFEELNNYDKDILWSNRYKLAFEQDYLANVFLCIDYSNPKHLIELEKIVAMAKPLNTKKCIELLNGKYIHESIRNFAVNCLRECSPNIEIQEFLYELVHGLRYEVNHDNELARFLLEKAVGYPVTIGHSFYWYLKSQMYEQNFQQRYGLYLEIFLNKIGPNLTKIFYDEDILLTSLQEISKTQLGSKHKQKDKLRLFQESIKAYNEKMEGDVSLPLNFKYRFKNIDKDKCKVEIQNGKHVKLIMSFENSDKLGKEVLVNYYDDQDLRTNLIMMQLFNILHTLWCEKKTNIKMPLYDVITTGRNKGMISIIPNSVVYDSIYGTKNFTLKKYLTFTSGLSEEMIFQNFMTSLVAYSVGNYIFGITQRNKKNIHIQNDAKVFYTSYDHLLDHFNKFYGNKGESFYISKYFVEYFGGEKGKKMKEFKDKFKEAYLILRNNGRDLVNLLRMLLSSGFPEISKKSIGFLDTTLCLSKSEAEAIKMINNAINYVMKK